MAEKMEEQLQQNTMQLKVSTVRNTFLTNLSASALIPFCKDIFTDAFQGELPHTGAELETKPDHIPGGQLLTSSD